MSVFHDLMALERQPLAETLAAHAPALGELEPGQWLGVVQRLTMYVTDGEPPTEYMSTCLAAYAYAVDTALAAGAIDHRESVIRRLNLSLNLLRKVPADPGLAILNPDLLVDLLLQELPMTAEEARSLSADWRNLEISQIRQLRYAKELLVPGMGIARIRTGEAPDPRLMPWEEVFPALP